MNNEIIRKIFLGKLANNENIPASKDYEDAKKKFDLLDKEMSELLNGNADLLAKYNKTIVCFDEASEQSETDHFVEGFKVGFLLATELLNDD